MSEEESAGGVVEMYESGMPWEDISDELGVTIDESMQRYRDEAFDHWDTGWGLSGETGTARVETGAVDLWTDGDASVTIEEVREEIPLTVIVNDGETRTLSDARLSASQARDLAATLKECAGILEENQ